MSTLPKYPKAYEFNAPEPMSLEQNSDFSFP
uniref:Uncharacterized protein n=1 Tax=Anguilla anguilla TaxID=7936 RepID=A0A0E9U799_ANGAN